MTKNSATFVYQDGLRCALEISHRGFFHRNLWNVFKVLKIEEPKELQASELWWKFLFQSYAGWGVNQLSTMPLFCSIQAIYWQYTGYKCKHPISLQIQKINSEAKGEGVWSIVMSNLGAKVSWCQYGIWMLSNYTALCIYIYIQVIDVKPNQQQQYFHNTLGCEFWDMWWNQNQTSRATKHEPLGESSLTHSDFFKVYR